MDNSLELAEINGGPIEFNPSLFATLEHSLIANPDGPAIIVAHQTPEYLWDLAGTTHEQSSTKYDCLSWSYAQLHRAACRLTLGLEANGVGFDSSMVCLLPNGVEWAALLWTSKIMRCCFSPLDYTALQAGRSLELQTMLSVVKPGALFVLDDVASHAAERALRAIDWSPQVKVVFTGTSSCPGWISLPQLVERDSDDPATLNDILKKARQDDGQRLDSILFTSGTSTGKPKGCPKRAISTAQAIAMQEFDRPNNHSTRSLLLGTNFRVIAPTQALNAWSHSAAIVMASATFDPGKIIEAIPRFEITVTVLIPALLFAIVSHPSFEVSKTKSFRSIRIGADMIVRSTYLQAAEAFPTAHICHTFGMTEGGSSFVWPFVGTGALDIRWFGEICTIGKVSPGATIKAADVNNNPVRRGELGALHLCSGTAISNYVDNVQSELFYKDFQGRQWFKTGDVAAIDPDGFCFILGREKDIIKRAGISITPAALESCINTFCATQSSVIGLPHPIYGAEPFAVVQSMGGKSEDEVKQQVLDSFGKDYVLGGVTTLDALGLESFPLNQTGKIVKRDLIDIMEKKRLQN